MYGNATRMLRNQEWEKQKITQIRIEIGVRSQTEK
jgi:hypothetical protein